MSNMQLGEDTITMSMTLNPVNEAAFQKAVQSLETLNRAAVFHPTGTGKSCIAWKVVEAHPQTTFFWLVAGAPRLALRRGRARGPLFVSACGTASAQVQSIGLRCGLNAAPAYRGST